MIRPLVLATIVIATAVLPALAAEDKLDAMLIEDWTHRESGVTLKICPNGDFSLVAADGAVLEVGEVRCAGWETADWTPGNYITGVLLVFRHEGKDWVVVGYCTLGEGSPMGLSLMKSRVAPRWLFGPFGATDAAWVLDLWGPRP